MLIYWIPPLAWMIFISPLNSLLTTRETSAVFLPLLSWVLPHLTPETKATLHVIFRKMGHFLGYALLASLLFRAFRGGAKTLRFSPVVAAGLISLGYAALDEYLQTLIPARTGSFYDWIIDSCGIASALSILLWKKKR